MLRNLVAITFRNILKNIYYVLINVFGLSIALACSIVAYLNWQYNNEFDTQHKKADQIYRVNYVRIMNNKAQGNGNCPMPLGEIIRNNFSQVTRVIRTFPTGGNFKIGDELFRTRLTCVDPDFFEMFTFRMIHGNGEEIRNKSRILISDILAKKYFAKQTDPLGQLMTYIQGNQRIEFVVGGVFEKPPQNSSFYTEDVYVHFDNLFDVTNWDENDWSLFNTTFLEISNPADVKGVQDGLTNYVEIQNKAKEDYKVDHYYLDPFAGMAVRAEREDLWNHWYNESLPVSAAIAPGIMAVLLLLLACFNFTNTSIAIAGKRMKEIGIRKVLGSDRKQLILQFLGENFLLSFAALILGLLFATLLVPLYSGMWTFLDIRLNLVENAGLLIFLCMLLLFTALIAGSYPSFYISSFQPVSILKGTQKYGGVNIFMKVLLTLQFGISVIGIVSGFIFSQNAEFQKQYDVGFNSEGVVIAMVNNRGKFEALKNELQDFSLITSMAGSAHSVAYTWYMDPVRYESVEMDANILDIGHDYLRTIGATLLDGRDFIMDNQNDVENSAIVNQEMVRIFGWKDPIGKRIVVKDTIPLYIVGVVKDIYLDGGLWNPLYPMILRYIPEDKYQFLSVSTSSSDLKEVYTHMEKKWQKLFPDELASINYLDENRAESIEVNNNIKIIFVFLGLTALLLSVIGLFSMVSLSIIKRIREIGIRKVLGASIPNILKTISQAFFIILIMASLAGSVAGYFLSEMMMESIWAYYLPIGWSPFVLSVSVLFLISAITVGWKIYDAAS